MISTIRGYCFNNAILCRDIAPVTIAMHYNASHCISHQITFPEPNYEKRRVRSNCFCWDNDHLARVTRDCVTICQKGPACPHRSQRSHKGASRVPLERRGFVRLRDSSSLAEFIINGDDTCSRLNQPLVLVPWFFLWSWGKIYLYLI